MSVIDAARICVALDVPDLDRAVGLVRQLAPRGVRVFKVGLGLWCQYGPAAVQAVKDAGGEVFLDLKLHDIPHQVGLAARAVAGLGASLLTVHASGGAEMVGAAREAAPTTRILAVTVLTSLSAEPGEVARRAVLAFNAGAHGLVCSPLEVAEVRAAVGPGAYLVIPGIRPTGAATHDQQRVGTPAAALAAGADLLVVGRPITEAADPIAGLDAVLKDA